MINALCYDLTHKAGQVERIEEFLSWFNFPFQKTQPDFSGICRATLLVEQSFADFGDLDLLVLLEHDQGRNERKRQAVLLEAKVSTDTNSWSTVDERFDEFVRMIDGGERKTSNLFVQLHRKCRLVEYARSGGHGFVPDILTPSGRIGDNHVVKRALGKLQEFIAEGGSEWYCAILPDDEDSLDLFARDSLIREQFSESLPTWETKRLGFLSWSAIKDRVDKNEERWSMTATTFKWNDTQIFRSTAPAAHCVQDREFYLCDGHHVWVVSNRGGQQRRVAILNGHDPDYFWTTKTISVSQLQPCLDSDRPPLTPTLPKSGAKYIWTDRNDGLPQTTEPHPAGMLNGTHVVVTGRPSWEHTRVRLPTDQPGSRGFLVHTHYLTRHARA